jgi:ABC-type branched-subunit amino acid transport system substrate-binding protein
MEEVDMKKKRWFCLPIAIFLVLGGFLMAGCGPEEPGVIKVGIAMTTSGPAAKLGTNVADGVKIAIKHFNDKGGVTVDGRQYTIELVEYDTAMKPEQGVSATKKLIEQDQVLVMFGDCISTVCLAQKPIIEGSLLAEEAALSLQVMETIAPAIEQAGGTVLTQDTFPPGTVDFYPLLTKLKKAAPEVVNIQGSGDAVTILKQASEIGFKPQWMVSTQVPINQLIEQIGGELTAGVWQIVMYDPESERASIKVFNEETEAYLGRLPSLLETLGYEGAMRMIMAIELADSLDRGKIVEALYKVDWEGVYFVGKYHANGEGTVGATTMQMTAEGTYARIE